MTQYYCPLCHAIAERDSKKRRLMSLCTKTGRMVKMKRVVAHWPVKQ